MTDARNPDYPYAYGSVYKGLVNVGGGKKVYHTYCVRKSENGKWFVGLTFMGYFTEKQSMIQRAFKVSGYFDNPEEAQNNLDWYARDNMWSCVG